MAAAPPARQPSTATGTPAAIPRATLPPCPQATKGRDSISFYTLPEYEEWREAHNTRGWSIKYYKVGRWGWGG